MLNLFLIDEEHEWVDSFIRDAFSSDKVKVTGVATNLNDAVENILELRPDVVLLDQSAEDGSGFAMAEKLIKQFDIPVYVTARHMHIDTWRKARMAGAAGTIKKPYSITDILESVSESLREEETSASKIIDFRARNEKPGKQRLVKNNEGSAIIRQEIITVYSPKGGVGKTTLACNFAIALKVKSSLDLSVCLVDLDTNFGNVEAVLQVDAKRNILDWDVFADEEFDRGLVNELVTKHKSGIDLVLSPALAHESTQIKGELAGKVIKTLSRYYDVVVCDVGPYLQADSTIVALDLATKILIIGTTDVPTLRNLHNCTRTFSDVLNIDQSKIRMVFNRMIKKHGLSMKEINQYIPYPVVGKIYEDEVVQRLANDGKLPVLSNPNGAFTSSLVNTINAIIPVCKEEKKRGWFSWLKRGRG